MPKTTGFAVFLQPNLPKEFLELFSEYLGDRIEGQTYLLSTEFEPAVHFVGLALLRRGKQEKTEWRVQIPVSYVLAVSEVHDPVSVGFV